MKKILILPLIAVFLGSALMPSVVSAHGKGWGPGPHYGCFLVNGEFRQPNYKGVKWFHKKWDKLERRGIRIEEVSCDGYHDHEEERNDWGSYNTATHTGTYNTYHNTYHNWYY